MELVFANNTAWVGVKGQTFQVVQGEAWHAGDPVVQAHPGLFNKLPDVVRGTQPVPPAEPVESATAAPGEKRTRTRRAD